MNTSQVKKLQLVALLYAAVLHSAYGESDNYCDDISNLGTRSRGLRFLGLSGEIDFAVVNVTKSLYCCAKEFATIEWLKDGKPYPWSRNTSSFAVDGDSDNRTLVSTGVEKSDTGVYTCIARNGSLAIQRNVQLKILAPELARNPRMTYAIQNAWVTTEQLKSTKLYCEGFVGLREGDGEDPKFSGTVTWEKGLTDRYLDRSFIDGYRVTQINCHRDRNQVVGSYLIFRDVRDMDLGMYTCRITNGNHRAVEQRAWVLDTIDPEDYVRSLYIAIYALTPLFLLVLVVLVFSTTSYINYYVYHPDKRRKVTKSTQISKPVGEPQKNNRRILAVYHTKDELLVSKQIMPKFLEMYPFKVTPFTVYDNEKDFEKLTEAAKAYECIVVIMTPSLVGDEWTCERIDSSIKIINKVHKAFICIFTKKIPPLIGKNGQKLKETLRRSEIHIVRRKSLSGKLLKAYLKRMNILRTTLTKQYSLKKK